MGPVAIWTNMWETLSDRTIAGFSIKKVMGAIAFTVLMYLTIRHTDRENLLAVIPMWQGFILSLVVVRAYEKTKGVADKPDLPNDEIK